jgi:hypothetical protein
VTTAGRYAINAPHIVHEAFEDGEVVMINLKSGQYYSVTGAGSEIWGMLARGASAGEIVERLASRYEGNLAEIIDAAASFLRELEREELVVVVEGGNSPAPASDPEPDHPKRPFQPLILERFNDMKELLLLDPIHEVEDAGWPHRKENTLG